MKIKTHNLSDHALDWAVAMAENWAGANFEIKPYSTEWAHGGPIIERDVIAIRGQDDGWIAFLPECLEGLFGPTPLIAAMRCYVASKLGDEVDVPDEIVGAIA